MTLREVYSWDGFWWIGASVSTVAIVAILFCVGLALAALLVAFKPTLHCRVPSYLMTLRTQQTAIMGEKHIARDVHEPLRISYVVAVSWKHRWLFGFLAFQPAEAPTISQNRVGD